MKLSDEEIINILKGTDKEIIKNIDILAKLYLEHKGRKLNKGCSSCITEMLLTLKNIYQMVQFKFKRHAASYKNKKGDTTTISNSTMTDEKALKFLKTNPKRIDLFLEQLMIINCIKSNEHFTTSEGILIAPNTVNTYLF